MLMLGDCSSFCFAVSWIHRRDADAANLALARGLDLVVGIDDQGWDNLGNCHAIHQHAFNVSVEALYFVLGNLYSWPTVWYLVLMTVSNVSFV
jgi:hypothetical protein